MSASLDKVMGDAYATAALGHDRATAIDTLRGQFAADAGLKIAAQKRLAELATIVSHPTFAGGGARPRCFVTQTAHDLLAAALRT